MGQTCCNYAPKDANLKKFDNGIKLNDKGKNMIVNNAEMMKAY